MVLLKLVDQNTNKSFGLMQIGRRIMLIPEKKEPADEFKCRGRCPNCAWGEFSILVVWKIIPILLASMFILFCLMTNDGICRLTFLIVCLIIFIYAAFFVHSKYCCKLMTIFSPKIFLNHSDFLKFSYGYTEKSQLIKNLLDLLLTRYSDQLTQKEKEALLLSYKKLSHSLKFA